MLSVLMTNWWEEATKRTTKVGKEEISCLHPFLRPLGNRALGARLHGAGFGLGKNRDRVLGNTLDTTEP